MQPQIPSGLSSKELEKQETNSPENRQDRRCVKKLRVYSRGAKWSAYPSVNFPFSLGSEMWRPRTNANFGKTINARVGTAEGDEGQGLLAPRRNVRDSMVDCTLASLEILGLKRSIGTAGSEAPCKKVTMRRKVGDTPVETVVECREDDEAERRSDWLK